jgi:hypothetical protein
MRRILIVLAYALSLRTNAANGDEVRVSTAALNLRRCPSTETCAVIRMLPPKSELKIIERKDDWLQVRVVSGGDTGWVHSRYTTEPEGAMPIGVVSNSSAGDLQGRSGKACKRNQLDKCVDVGRVDDRGNIFKFQGLDLYDDQGVRIGFVNKEGKIYRVSEGFGDDVKAGFVDKDGRVYMISSLDTDDAHLIGVVQGDGKVYKVAEFPDQVLIGQVDAPVILAGGPALLLLFEEPQKGRRRP